MVENRSDLGFCQNILNGVATPVIQISPDRTIQMINDAALEILGLNREQAVGQKCHELFRTDDCEGGECATLRAMKEKRKIESETIAHIRGKDIPIHYYASPLYNDSGEVIGAVEYFEDLTELRKKEDDLRRAGKEIQGVFAAARDITVLRQSESRLAQSRDYYLKILDEFPNPIWRSGTDTKCNYFNKAWLKFTGRTLEEECDDGWATGVHPDDLQRCIDLYLSSFEKRSPFYIVYRLRHHDGTYHRIADYGAPIYDLKGEFTGYIGSCYDLDNKEEP